MARVLWRPPGRGRADRRLSWSPTIPTWILLPIVVAAVGAIFLTTPLGKRLAGRVGLPLPFAGSVDPESRAYLLRACGGDRREMARRLDAERERFPELDEAAIHRRAIRAVVTERGGPEDLDLPS